MSKELSRRDLIRNAFATAAAVSGIGGVAKGAWDQEHGFVPDTIGSQVTCTGKPPTESCAKEYTIIESDDYTEEQKLKIDGDAVAWVASIPLASAAYFIAPAPIPKNSARLFTNIEQWYYLWLKKLTHKLPTETVLFPEPAEIESAETEI